MFVSWWCYQSAIRQIETNDWYVTDGKLYMSVSANKYHLEQTDKSLSTDQSDKQCWLDSEDVVRSGCRDVSQQQFFYINRHQIIWFIYYYHYVINRWLIHRKARKRICRSRTQCFRSFEWGYCNPNFGRLLRYQLSAISKALSRPSHPQVPTSLPLKRTPFALDWKYKSSME